jgi:serine/threonine protein kinase
MQEQFGRYSLVRRLAVGGMAEIYLAALRGDAGFEKRVVIKRILPRLSRDDAFVRMFVDEAMLASKLAHPNIIEVHDFGQAAGSYFMAMAYVDGVDLHQLMLRSKHAGRPLREAEVAAIGEQIARGLGYTHALRDESGAPLHIVHRDVSPHNIMLSTQGEIKVMDFGIAKAAARASGTLTGTIKGKLAYMAPEQARGEAATARSDQYALGIVLWELLHDRRLYEEESEVALIRRVATADRPDWPAREQPVPAALRTVIDRALSPDPKDRYPDLDQLAEALTAARYALGSAGRVRLASLATQAANDVAQSDSWSWAQHSVAQGGGTRVLPYRGADTLRTTGATAPGRPVRGRRAPTPARGHHAALRRPKNRSRWPLGTQRFAAAQHEPLPWLLVGMLLAALTLVVGRAYWPTEALGLLGFFSAPLI